MMSRVGGPEVSQFKSVNCDLKSGRDSWPCVTSSVAVKLRNLSASCGFYQLNPIRPGLFSRSPGPGGSEAQMPKIKVNINQLK